jgi:NTP pyrophosphatase (non-canonical NTP hydrolase)
MPRIQETQMTYSILELDVIRWAEARKIIPNSTPVAQARKTQEEAAEILEAASAMAVLAELARQGADVSAPMAYWRAKYKDGIGDTLVTLIVGAALADVDVQKCLADAYAEIKDRKGTLGADGIFRKEQ